MSSITTTSESLVVEFTLAVSTLASAFPLATDLLLVHAKKGSAASTNVLYELLNTIISGGDYMELAKEMKVDVVEKALALTIEPELLADRIKQIQDHYKQQIEVVCNLH